MEPQAFEMAAASAKTTWLLFAIALVPITLLVVVLGASLVGMKTARFEVSTAGLRLRGDLYGRTIPASELLGGGARRVNFAAAPELRPSRRTWGTGLPGYRAGWFRLRNGEKALLYMTDLEKAVYVPTRAGYAVMLSPKDPDAFIAALREVAPSQ